MRSASARATLLALLAAFALGAWFLLRDGGMGERGAAEPPPAAEKAAAPSAELEQPLAVESQAVERTAVAEPEPESTDDLGVIEIRDARERPCALASWAVFRGEEVLAHGMTQWEGLAVFPRGEGAAELAVLPADEWPQRFPIDLGQERQAIALQAGATLAGWVEVDGLAPGERLDLTLIGELADGSLPAPVLAALAEKRRQIETLWTSTAADGAFRFQGLPAEWSGTLNWPRDLFLLGDEQEEVSRLLVPAPVEGLRVRLTTGARIIGTVVDPLTGAGVPGSIWGSFSWDLKRESRSRRTEDDGTFVFAFPRDLPGLAELKASTRAGAGTRSATFLVPPGLRVYDAGGVAIRATRTADFAVRDEDGRPIAGAEAQAVPEEEGSARSDADGHGSLELALAAQGLRVTAEGFLATVVPLPPPGETASVVLRGGTVLEVHLLPAERTDLALGLWGTEPPFLNAGVPSWIPEAPYSNDATWGSGQGSVSLRNRRNQAAGIFVLGGVREGIAFHLRAVDRYGTAGAELTVPPLSPGERRIVELAVAGEPRALEGRVVSQDGAAVSGAHIAVGAVGDMNMTFEEADDGGRFRLEGLLAPRVHLQVAAEGFAALELADQAVADSPLELVLERGRSVRVEVVGPSGEPVPEAWVAVWNGPGVVASQGEPVEPGVYEVEHVPGTDCTLAVNTAGMELKQPLPAGATEMRVEVGAWRACHVRVEGWADIPRVDNCSIVLRSVDAGLPRQLWKPRTADDVARFEVVLPGRYEAYVMRKVPPAYQEERLSPAVEVDVALDASATPIPVTLVVDKP